MTSSRMSLVDKLIYTAGKGYLEDLISVLEQGVNVDAKDELGNTALRTHLGFGVKTFLLQKCLF